MKFPMSVQIIGSALLALQLIAYQTASPAMKECGLGKNPDHPCHCLEHTNQVQNEYMEGCLRIQFETNPRQKRNAALAACATQMPEHCSIIEHYGNWETDDDGNHINPMPGQCSQACTRAHCKCQDGEVCHIAHNPGDAPEDQPQKGKKNAR